MSTRQVERFLERAVTVPGLGQQVHALLQMGEAAAETVARLANDRGFTCRPEDVLEIMAHMRGSRDGMTLADGTADTAPDDQGSPADGG